jgi:hypothetical protein
MSELPDLVAGILSNVLRLQAIVVKVRQAKTLMEARASADEAHDAPLGEIAVAANAAAREIAQGRRIRR